MSWLLSSSLTVSNTIVIISLKYNPYHTHHLHISIRIHNNPVLRTIKPAATTTTKTKTRNVTSRSRKHESGIRIYLSVRVNNWAEELPRASPPVHPHHAKDLEEPQPANRWHDLAARAVGQHDHRRYDGHHVWKKRKMRLVWLGVQEIRFCYCAARARVFSYSQTHMDECMHLYMNTCICKWVCGENSSVLHCSVYLTTRSQSSS